MVVRASTQACASRRRLGPAAGSASSAPLDFSSVQVVASKGELGGDHQIDCRPLTANRIQQPREVAGDVPRHRVELDHCDVQHGPILVSRGTTRNRRRPDERPSVVWLRRVDDNRPETKARCDHMHLLGEEEDCGFNGVSGPTR